MNYAELTDKLLKNIEDKLSGKNLGMTSGFKDIDGFVGRIQRGQLWTVGGNTGIGKSYFILNMIKGILTEKENLKIAIFSTELSDEDYLLRYICMQAGIYKLQLQKYTKDYAPKIKQALINFYENRLDNPNSFDIYGNIYNFAEIEKAVTSVDYDICFIDYVQELTIMGRYDVKDTMPILAKELKNLALSTNTAIIAVSQVNNYANTKGFDVKESQLQPFSFGKELIQSSSTALVLKREKKDGKLDPVVQCHITKARDGELGIALYNIRSGFLLTPMEEQHALEYLKHI